MKYLLKITLSFLIATYVAVFFGWKTAASQKQCLLVWLFVLLVTRYLAAIFFKRYVDERPLNRRAVVLSFLFAAAVAGLGFSHLVPAPESEHRAQVTVTALGERDPASKSSEVWIAGIDNGGANYDLTNLPMDSGWERKPENLIVSYRHQPASLSITVNDAKTPVVRFLEQGWSGKVMVSDGSKDTVVNLYKKDREVYNYTISNIWDVPSGGYIAKRAVFFLLAVASFFSVLYALWVIVTNSRQLPGRKHG
jgi:hypothetical protein